MSEFERRGFKDDRVIFEKHVRGRYRIIIIIIIIIYKAKRGNFVIFL